MKIEFHKKTFVILGTLVSMGKAEAWKTIEALGGFTSQTPRPTSDYIVVARNPGKKLALVAKVNKPMLTEAEFLAAIEAAQTGREPGQQDVGVGDALAGLRELVHDAPNPEVWKQIQAWIDHCAPDHIALAVDYAEHHLAGWPSAVDHPAAPTPQDFDPLPQELRVFSPAWRAIALAGERSPRLRLGRRMDLSKMELKAEDALRITDHPDLVNLQMLNLGAGNQHGAAFMERLRLSRHLPRLEALTIHFLNDEGAEALCGDHNLKALRHVTVARRVAYGWEAPSGATYDKLFHATWWEQIEGLACCTSGTYGAYGHRSTIYPQIAAHAHRLARLRHLVIEDSNRVEALLETHLFRQLRRVSLAGCSPVASEAILDHLAEHQDTHTVEALDLSRCIFMGLWRRPKMDAKPSQEAAVQRLLLSPEWGALRAVTVEPGLLGARLRKALEAWGEQAGVTLSSSPWSA